MNKEERMERLSKEFSYLGNTNNPPDMMLRSGDAIEVKKIESSTSALALNSSATKTYGKRLRMVWKLFRESPFRKPKNSDI